MYSLINTAKNDNTLHAPWYPSSYILYPRSVTDPDGTNDSGPITKLERLRRTSLRKQDEREQFIAHFRRNADSKRENFWIAKSGAGAKGKENRYYTHNITGTRDIFFYKLQLQPGNFQGRIWKFQTIQKTYVTSLIQLRLHTSFKNTFQTRFFSKATENSTFGLYEPHNLSVQTMQISYF